jgi:hypothetical protein
MQNQASLVLLASGTQIENARKAASISGVFLAVVVDFAYVLFLMTSLITCPELSNRSHS